MATCNGDLYTQTIERDECIGNSLSKINSNFAALDFAVCDLSEVKVIEGILKGDGSGAITAAVAGTDYYVPETELASLSIDAKGTIKATGDIIAFSSSDERLKKNITNISDALNKISSIRGVEYEWNTDLQDTYQGKDVGVIAQDIEKVLPVAVIERDNGYKAVKYERIIPLLIEAIKELKNEVELLKSQKSS